MQSKSIKSNRGREPETVRSALRTLGTFELRIDNRPVPALPTHKARALVAFLVSNRGLDIARERLLELLWGDYESERAREGLRTALSSVRHAVRIVHEAADDLLLADKSIVRWVAPTDFDVSRFDELARSTALSDKRLAVSMYAGDFLEGSYEEWVVRERDRISGLYEAVLADLVTQAQDVDAARILLTRNPFHEEAYGALIDMQVRANRPSAAAELVEQYRAAMREIHAEPSAEFQRRFVHLQGVSGRKRAAPRVEAPASQTNLPVALTSFVGRSGDLADLKRLVRASRLVTLVGPGGIGKTRLATQAAGDLRTEFSDGVWFVDLATVPDARYVLSGIASVLGVSTASLDRALQEALIVAVQKRGLLLVLDNCEHVLAALAPIVAELLRTCPGIRVLCTSREPLKLEGEDILRLSGLPQADAIALFVERARATDKQFEMSGRNAPIVAAICERLDGIPLAIELAAPRVSVLSIKHLQRKLDDHFRILTSGDATALPRHKTVRALIDWSYELLSAREQLLFKLTGVFVGGFTLEGASALAAGALAGDEVLDVLSSLAAKSLVQVEAQRESERYALLQITQQYALEKLEESGDLPAARERHVDYFLKLARQADDAHGAANAREWLECYHAEMDNVRAAIEYSFGSGDPLSGAGLIAAARELWQDLSLYAEGLHRAERAMKILPDDAPLALRAGLWLVAAQLGNVLLLTWQSRDWGQRASDAFEMLHDEPHLAYALQTLGFTLIRCGAHEDAETALIRAQSLAERLGNRRIIARVLLRRAHNAHAMGALERALPLYERCLSLSRTIEDDLYVGFALDHLANVYFSIGDLPQCISYGRAAREVFRRRKDAAKESNALGNLAECHIAMGQFAEAKEAARASIEKALESESTVNAVYAVQHLAAIAAAERRPQTAARLLGYAQAALSRLTPLPENTYTRDRAMEMLQAQLGGEELGLLLSEGAELTDGEAYALAAPRETPAADAP